MLGTRSDHAAKEKDFKFWVNNVSELAFPRFHIRIARDMGNYEKIIGSPICMHRNAHVYIADCQPYRGQTLSREVCFAVNTDRITAENRWNARFDESRITCYFNTTGSNFTYENFLVAWELEEIEGEHVANFGGNSYSSIWFGPEAGAWVMLKKFYVKFSGRLETEWERELIYHSSVYFPGHYSVSTILASFDVTHIEQSDVYNGWLMMGDSGGFTFAMVLFHTLIMILVGIGLTNNSKFLGAFSEGYENIGGPN